MLEARGARQLSPAFLSAMLVVALLGSLRAAAADGQRDVPDALRDALVARLALSTQVAHAKFAAHQPIEDRAREAIVINAMTAISTRFGLEPTTAADFGRALIEAAKAIQRAQFARWSQGPPPDGPVPDLTNSVRPALDTATNDLLRACALELTALQNDARRRAALSQSIAATGVDYDHTAKLISTLTALRYRTLATSESALDIIAARGVLRVGVTGDYAPFGFAEVRNAESASSLTGIDVDLANDLAQSLGVTLRIVPTSWPSLSKDLATNQFDLALGGITRTLARARNATFSIPYFADGKSAIARCSDRARFKDLAAIDTPGVRIIVNPGGTNEQYVRAHITRATVSVNPDNLSIFAALAKGSGDVMITDLVEARFQAARNPTLCVALGGAQLTHADKAILLPRDAPLKEFVDLWLHQLQVDGRLDAVVSRYLPTARPSQLRGAPAHPLGMPAASR